MLLPFLFITFPRSCHLLLLVCLYPFRIFPCLRLDFQPAPLVGGAAAAAPAAATAPAAAAAAAAPAPAAPSLRNGLSPLICFLCLKRAFLRSFGVFFIFYFLFLNRSLLKAVDHPEGFTDCVPGAGQRNSRMGREGVDGLKVQRGCWNSFSFFYPLTAVDDPACTGQRRCPDVRLRMVVAPTVASSCCGQQVCSPFSMVKGPQNSRRTARWLGLETLSLSLSFLPLSSGRYVDRTLTSLVPSPKSPSLQLF